MVPARFELSTPCLQGQNSTTELRLLQEFRAKKLVASWNNSDWQFLKWIAGTLVKSQFWFFNSFCSTIFLLTNNIYIISTGSRLVEIYISSPFFRWRFRYYFFTLALKMKIDLEMDTKLKMETELKVMIKQNMKIQLVMEMKLKMSNDNHEVDYDIELQNQRYWMHCWHTCFS